LADLNDCSIQQPKQPSGNSPTAEASLSSQQHSPTINASKPDLVYAHIESSAQPASGNGVLYANVKPTNDYQTPRTVIYSELQNKDAVAPAGDLYAEVEKR